jgi:hypothetical protein
MGVLWMSSADRGGGAQSEKSIARYEKTSATAEDSLPPVAEITRVSPDAVWEDPNDSYVLAARVRSGQTLALEHGVIELTYASGTTLRLTGPSEFLVSPTGGTLARGEVRARVTEQGHGFTIMTPHGKVIDLGTEFGLVVDDFGVSEVRVFAGKVEAFPDAHAGTPNDKIELTTGRGLQWNKSTIIPVSARGRSFEPSPFELSGMAVTNSATTIVNEDFRAAPLNDANWQTLGGVRSSAEGLHLRGESDAAKQPYLISRQEFDPSNGPIAVSCELQFNSLQESGRPSFSILTRSADQPSKPGTPWADSLAQCVRCSFKADDQTGDGLLEAGVKYEADRELTNISWRGFARPEEKTAYRLDMRDDGLNVAFTVSLAANPSVRKTVTCRSLFRGNRNFIALEGSREGAVIVKNVRISQERMLGAGNAALAQSASGGMRESRVSAKTIAKLLAELAPAQAKLVLRDDFDAEQLNPQVWMTLGDVSVEDNQLQLGAPNVEEHIDTWTRRPYLLTTDEFSPSSAPLTIVGSATFAPNYLQGYGASFAIMTRADKEYGKGWGWVKSILRRGIRSNFWPAALGQNHSLEILEKPEPETISLLVADGFPINPQNRTYVFRVIDDGNSASLTLIDAANPEVRKTISHPTASMSRARGHIAFESCWGSPILLDHIRIYQTKRPSGPADR